VINVSPDKHRGYALQWFAMALVLLSIFVWRGFVPVDSGTDTGTHKEEN